MITEDFINRYNEISYEEVMEEVCDIKYGRSDKDSLPFSEEECDDRFVDNDDNFQEIDSTLNFQVPLEFGQRFGPCEIIRHAEKMSLPGNINPKALYDCVKLFYADYDLSSNIESPFVRHRFPEIEKRNLIDHIRLNGFDLDHSHFRVIINICKKLDSEAVDDDTLSARPVSLNNSDYDRLVNEIGSLRMNALYGYDIERFCPTLCRLINETEMTKDAPYPGRHLSFKKIKGIRPSSLNRFQILLIMDEILYRRRSPINNVQMAWEIKRRMPKYAVLGELEQKLSKYWVILSELICCSSDLEGSHNYLYAYIQRDGIVGHQYDRLPLPVSRRKEKVSAFRMMITVEEATEIEAELKKFVSACFKGDSEGFTVSYPLLGVFANLSSIVKDSSSRQNVSYTDIKTVRYGNETKVDNDNRH